MFPNATPIIYMYFHSFCSTLCRRAGGPTTQCHIFAMVLAITLDIINKVQEHCSSIIHAPIAIELIEYGLYY